MAKLYFRYGAMGSSKTANALMVCYNYEEKGQKAIILKPRVDKRDGDVTIRSRIGLEREGMYAEDFLDNVRTNWLPLLGPENEKPSEGEWTQYQCIIVDEVQFLKRSRSTFLRISWIILISRSSATGCVQISRALFLKGQRGSSRWQTGSRRSRRSAGAEGERILTRDSRTGRSSGPVNRSFSGRMRAMCRSAGGTSKKEIWVKKAGKT